MASNAKALSFLSGDLSLSGTEVSINVAGSVQSDSITGSTITMKNTGSTIVASDGTTSVLSESSGTVTIDADVSTIGSATISGGSITGTEIDLKSSGTTIFASDGTTAVLSESGGVVTLTANAAVIEGSSSGDLVRITQTGSGNALVVEDSANPDATPFVVDSSGNLMLGGAANSWSTLQAVQVDRASISGYVGNSYLSHNFYANSGGSKYIASGGASQIRLAENSIIFNYASSGSADASLSFSESMRIDSSGNVGIGTGSPQDGLDVAKNARIGQGQISADSTVGVLGIYGGLGPSSTNSQLRFFGKSVSNTGLTYEIARISGSSFGPYSLSGGIQFSTASNDGANNLTLTERMRIDSSGKVLVGGISAEPSGGFGGILFGAQSAGNNASFKTTASANVGASIVSIRNTDGIQISFHQGGSYIGSITTNGSNTAFNTSSDYRLKENITEITDGITRVKQLNPFRFNFIANPENTVDGFIAHEVQDIVPEAISGEKDAVNEDGSIRPQGIDQSKLVPLLTAALQEAIALIESQQSQIDTLTAKTQEQDFTIASLISRIEALENP